MCEEANILRERLDQLFEQARRMIEHEDKLVDTRLKWVITTTAFLGAVFAGTVIGEGDINWENDPIDKTQLAVLRTFLGVVAIFACYLGAKGIFAAHAAIRNIVKRYGKFILANEQEIRSGGFQVWKLVGDQSTHVPGFQSAMKLPYLLAWAWAILATIQIMETLSILLLGREAFQDFWYWALLFTFGAVFGHLLNARSKRKEHKLVDLSLTKDELTSLRKLNSDSFDWKLADGPQSRIEKSK